MESYLSECLESILAEPAPELEVVVVDDRSPDRSGRLADQFARQDPRVRVLHLPINVGLGRARNAGLAAACGSYLWFVDGDDWLPEGAVRAVLGRISTVRPDVLVVDHAKVSTHATTAMAPPGVLTGPPGPLAHRPELIFLDHSACTKIVRRSFLDEIGLRFDRGWYEDSSYSHPLLLAAGSIDSLDQVCYCYRQRDGAGSITRSVSLRHFEVFAQYERMWQTATRAAPATYARFRPALFRLMIDHLLVIAGNERRIPPGLRREFFRRTAGAYRRWCPPGGYPVPGGVEGIKHRLVRWRAYELYRAMRLARRLVGDVRGQSGRAVMPPGSGAGGSTVEPDRAVDVGAVRQREGLPAGEVGMVGAQPPHSLGQLFLPLR